jgi:O-antigen ligase
LGLCQNFDGGVLIARFAQLVSTDHTGEGRAQLWTETVPLIKAYPIFGCGRGGYETAFLKFKAFELLVTDDFAHNDYLQLLAELGIVGFVIVAALALSVVRMAVRKAVASADPETLNSGSRYRRHDRAWEQGTHRRLARLQQRGTPERI